MIYLFYISRVLIISTCFSWNLQVPFFGYRLFDLICPIRKTIAITSLIVKKKTKLWENVLMQCLTKCPESWLITEDYMACISSLCFLSKQCSEIYINNTKTISFVSKYTSICPTRFYMQVLLPTNLSCFSSVTCL